MGDPTQQPGQQVLDTLADGVVVADASGCVTLVNLAAGRLLRTQDGVGKHLSDVVLLQDRAGNSWFSCTEPYAGLTTRTALSEQAWYLADGTELLVAATGRSSRCRGCRSRCAPPAPGSASTGGAPTWSPPSPTSFARRSPV